MLIERFHRQLAALDPVLRSGRVTSIAPTHIDADGPNLPLGTMCSLGVNEAFSRGQAIAEIVRVHEAGIVLSPLEMSGALRVGARVVARGEGALATVGPAALGRAIDALGRPIDGAGELDGVEIWPLLGHLPPALERKGGSTRFETGIRAIDGLLPLAMGQRVGLFAPSGAGKTTLTSQIVAHAHADVVVVCLIGERGREVSDMWDEVVNGAARRRTILVAATSDDTAAMRVRAAHCALAHAEFWRAQGRHVLLLLDSATRLAMAMREIGFAAGEPPTARGYTPSVFAQMPKIVERCGALRGGGAITAIMTVLSETEDNDDPVCELLKSILDGHILLARSLAEKGQFPAIDLLRSISRQSEQVMDGDQRQHARKVMDWLVTYEASRTLIETGLYLRGSNPAIDHAIDGQERARNFVIQDRKDNSPLTATLARLAEIAKG